MSSDQWGVNPSGWHFSLFTFHSPPLGEAGRGLGNAVKAVQVIRASGAVFEL